MRQTDPKEPITCRETYYVKNYKNNANFVGCDLLLILFIASLNSVELSSEENGWWISDPLQRVGGEGQISEIEVTRHLVEPSHFIIMLSSL